MTAFTPAVLAQAEVDVEALEAALAAIDDKTYGQCSICGQPIGGDRLDGNPLARTCTAHEPTI